MSRNIIILSLIVLLGYGCSNFEKDIVCFIRLGDCNCVYHPEKVECHEDTVKNKVANPPIFSECICKLANNDVQVFFNDKPSKYGEFPQKPIPVYNNACVNFNLCPEPITIVTGSLFIAPERWTFHDDLIGQRDYSVLEGTPTDKDGNSLTVKSIFREKNKIKMKVASIDDGIVIGASKLQCKAECDKDSFYCSNLPVNSIGFSRGNSLKNLQKKIHGSSEEKIQISEILSMFGLQDDPCDRSEIDVSNGKMRNSGRACEIRQQADFGPSGVVILKMDIPEQLQAEVTSYGSELEIYFPEEKNSALLTITDKNEEESWLNSDYGGLVYRIQTTSNKAIFSTSSGCISVAFE
ncbi:MAG: hypothetical protein GY928_16650 [Colwellia sp.]|nr:hypothetical protein [Colwellia sp.]